MEKLRNVKVCTICMGINLTYLPNHVHEDVELNDYSANEATFRTDDVVKCNDCDTLFYIEDGKLVTQFEPKREIFKFVPQINDNQVHLYEKK